jgi:hypothetical protein
VAVLLVLAWLLLAAEEESSAVADFSVVALAAESSVEDHVAADCLADFLAVAVARPSVLLAVDHADVQLQLPTADVPQLL